MAGFLDRCIWTATSSGTGSYVQSAAAGGFQTMQNAGAVDGQVYPYVAQSADLTQWEVGLGTWTAATSTLARTTIYNNSIGGTSAINFTSIPQVLVTIGAVGFRAIAAVSMGGRLTLTSNTPVLTANTTAQGTVYYTPYLHGQVTCWDGVGMSSLPFTEQSITLDATNFLSGKLYDVFAFLNAGAVDIGYGPAWTNTTTRSAGTALVRVNGIWVNNTTITLRTDASTTFSIATNQAVFLGTVYATANAQTGMNFDASGAGGAKPILGIFNAYNRLPQTVKNRDSSASWTYAATTWRAQNNNANNSVCFVDGLGEVQIQSAVYNNVDFNSTAPVTGQVGQNLNSTSATPATLSWSKYNTAADNGSTMVTVMETFLPALGFNTITAMESGHASTTFFGGAAQNHLMATVQV